MGNTTSTEPQQQSLPSDRIRATRALQLHLRNLNKIHFSSIVYSSSSSLAHTSSIGGSSSLQPALSDHPNEAGSTRSSSPPATTPPLASSVAAEPNLAASIWLANLQPGGGGCRRPTLHHVLHRPEFVWLLFGADLVRSTVAADLLLYALLCLVMWAMAVGLWIHFGVGLCDLQSPPTFCVFFSNKK